MAQPPGVRPLKDEGDRQIHRIEGHGGVTGKADREVGYCLDGPGVGGREHGAGTTPHPGRSVPERA